MARACQCGETAEPKRIVPVWLIVILFLSAAIPGIGFLGLLFGILALYCRNRLVACPGCGKVRWKF